MDFSIVLAASAAVNRLIESVKPAIRKLPYAVEVQDGLLVFLALLAGIAVALMGNLSLFAGVATVPPLVAVLLTGAIIGLGADAIHVIIDLLYSWRDAARPTDGAVLAYSGEPVTATAEVTVG